MAEDIGVCPVCGHNDIDYGSADIDGHSVNYKCTCNRCQSIFTEGYEMEHVETWIDYNSKEEDFNAYND